ncbi:MAG: HAD-IC family P-type ATPase [Cyanobacteria bacterium]|nr:HAD-IC family P-type ATPase [Cyanobacteriota bacterium]MDW8201342.1 HAD-IC family P-type ATPase [Cyanobacteriota bacterium SKYGB_h_bin112]
MVDNEHPLVATQGLTQAEVAQRRANGQGNNAKLPSSRSYREIFQENLFTFINAVFLTISIVLVLLNSYGDAILVVVVIFSGVIVSIYQEIWAKRQLDRIALLNRPSVSVIRDGREQTIDPADIVLEDIVVVRSGDQILVDGTIVGDGRLDVDESLLTGESDTIVKQSGDPVYSGTICVSGHACFQATKVGVETIAYQLVTGARAFRQIYTPLQKEINLVIRAFLLLACFLWILVGISFLGRSYSISDAVQRAAVIAGLVPTGLLLAITLAYGIAAVHMVGDDILIQQANAVESLSNVDVLCSDKTGTLTTNEITVETIVPLEATPTELAQALGDFAANVTTHNRTSEALAVTYPGCPRTVKAEVAFSSVRRWSAIVMADEPKPGLYVLGAPETLTSLLALTPDMADRVANYVTLGTSQGFRVLLFAYAADPGTVLTDPDNPLLPSALQPLGIVHLSDQLRPEAKRTLQSFAQAGIQVKIISGDHPQTVAALAKQAGLDNNQPVISGQDLAHMSDDQFAQVVARATVFGRVTPDQKAQLVKSLRRQGHYVAMIGDGVNDVLSLKQANLGIAMESGSKATRGVADIVLLRDSFAALPHAFLEGQRIRSGIRDVLTLFIVRVLCTTILIFATAMATDSFPLVNKHSAITALIGVGFPAAVMPAWAKPRPVTRRRSVVRSLLHFTIPAAVTMSFVALLVYMLYLVKEIINLPPGVSFQELDYTLPRTMLVTILVFCELLLIPFLKPPTPAWTGGEPLSGDWRYSATALGLLGLYLLILYIPPLRQFFELAALTPRQLGFLVLVALEWCLILRAVWRTRFLDKFLGVDLS